VRSIRRTVLVAALAVAAAACGTTVPIAGTSSPTALGGVQAPETGLPPSTGDALTPGTRPPASADARGAAGQSTREGVGSDPTVRAGGPVAGGVKADGPRSTVTVGFWGGSGDTTTTLGGNGSQSLGDEQQQFQALVDDANANGGLAGHRIRAVYFANSAAATNDDQANQEACAFFTQDQRSFAVFTSQNIANALLRSCLGRHNIPLVKNYLADVGEATMRRFPLYLMPSTMNLDRIAATQPAALEAMRFFARDASVGIVTQDDAEFAHAVDNVLVPLLAKRGHEVRAIARFQTPTDANSIQAGAAAASNAVLRFRQEGVDHVVFLSPNGFPATVFTNAAESQQYHPRYAFTSQDAIQALVEAGLVQNPSAQLRGAVGIGWIPSIDVPFLTQGQFNDRPRNRQCLNVLAKRQQRPDSSQELLHMVLNCDAFWLIRDALAGRTLTPASVTEGVNALGRRFPVAASFASRLAGDRHDGAAQYRQFAYTGSCGCFRYTTPPQPTA